MSIYDMETGVVFWTLLIISGTIGLVVTAFFLLNLRNLLNQVSAQNRAMQPNYVWLNFIPVFSLVWMIITVIKVRDSVRAEFQARGWTPQGDFGYGVGLAFAISTIVQLAFTLAGLASLVCLIIYWMKTAELKNQLRRWQAPGGGSAPGAPPPPPPSSIAGGPGAGAGETQASIEPTEAATDATAEPTAQSEMTCPVCGEANRQNAKFCRSCGRSL